MSLLDIELICTAIHMWQGRISWIGITRPTNNSQFIETLKNDVDCTLQETKYMMRAI